MKTVLVSIAALSTVLAGAPALAAQSGTQTATVRLSDIDLTSAAGHRVLNQRVAAATEAVCGSYQGAGQEEQRKIAHCRAEVSAQIGPQLAAARSRGSVATR